MRDFKKILHSEEIILADGAMGTYLHQKGVPLYHTFFGLNLDNPSLVKSIHLEYISAGANLIETNTFGANLLKLREYGLEKRCYDVNLKGAQIAREVAKLNVYVGGSIGPLGKPLSPIGKLKKEEIFDAIYPQIKGLVDGGVDALFIETQISLEEAKEIVKIAREIAPYLPIVLTFSFMEDGRTSYGITPEEVAETGEELKVDCIGANCGVGPIPILEVIYKMKKLTNIPLCVMPNAGLPSYKGGEFYFPVYPEHFSKYTKAFISAGCKIIGSCCGTTPKHTLAMKNAILEHKREDKVQVIIEEKEKEEKFIKKEKIRTPNRVRDKIEKGEFFVSVEVHPPRGVFYDKEIMKIEEIRNAGVDVVNVVDLAMARLRMSSIAFSHILKSQTGVEPIVHFTCRDRNILGIQADLLGAYALGLKNILAITGDPPSVGDYPHATAIYDVTARGLIKIISLLNNGKDISERDLNLSTDFFIGTTVNINSSSLLEEVSRLLEKIDLGAQFVITQPVYDKEKVSIFKEKLKKDIPIIIGILPLKTLKMAEYFAREVPGIEIPEWFLNTLEQKAKKQEDILRFSIEKLSEMVKEIKGLIQGISISLSSLKKEYIEPFLSV